VNQDVTARLRLDVIEPADVMLQIAGAHAAQAAESLTITTNNAVLWSRNDGAGCYLPGDDLVDHLRVAHLVTQPEEVQEVHPAERPDRLDPPYRSLLQPAGRLKSRWLRISQFRPVESSSVQSNLTTPRTMVPAA